MTPGYWDPSSINHARLLWAVATRRQLERWEPLVAKFVADQLGNREINSANIWAAQIEHHLALVSANHLLQAQDLDQQTSVPVDPTLRAELKEGRDLHEHWKENMPVFNVTPRVAEPKYPSGESFAARNPDDGPYWWLGWLFTKGAFLLPNVTAAALYALLDAVEADVLAKEPECAVFVPPRAPSPWVRGNGEWWPGSLASGSTTTRLTTRPPRTKRRAQNRLDLAMGGDGIEPPTPCV